MSATNDLQGIYDLCLEDKRATSFDNSVVAELVAHIWGLERRFAESRSAGEDLVKRVKAHAEEIRLLVDQKAGLIRRADAA